MRTDLGDEARADLADLIDLQMSPLGLAAIDALAPTPGQTVLDVGCGAGQTILQLADRIGATGHVIGVDIAPRALAVARARTGHLPQVSLLQGDAASVVLRDHSVDAIYSRFGMMFFADPIGAFANFRRLLRSGGRISFVCWRSIVENQLDAVPVEAAQLQMPIGAMHFSFERPTAIERVLRLAGFQATNIEPFDAGVSCGDVDATLRVVTRVGALGMVLRESPALRSEAEPRVRRALAACEKEDRVSLKAATWIVTASND